MYLIRQLAAKYNLTRTALLHYDSIGLLTPSARTEAGYRLYSEEDEKKLHRILLFRSMGIPLDKIKRLIEKDESRIAGALMNRLNELNREIGELKKQQKNIINLLKEVKILEEFLNKENHDYKNFPLLNGIDPSEWHKQFEAMSPELHKEFLEILRSIPENIKESLQKALNSLPKEERKELNRIFGKQYH